MKIILIDGEKIKGKAQLHSEFKKKLKLPSYYGNNLDALYDSITEMSGGIGVIAVNTEEIKEKIGDYWESFLNLMKDLEREKEDFYFLSDPFGNNR